MLASSSTRHTLKCLLSKRIQPKPSRDQDRLPILERALSQISNRIQPSPSPALRFPGSHFFTQTCQALYLRSRAPPTHRPSICLPSLLHYHLPRRSIVELLDVRCSSLRPKWRPTGESVSRFFPALPTEFNRKQNRNERICSCSFTCAHAAHTRALVGRKGWPPTSHQRPRHLAESSKADLSILRDKPR